MPVEDTEAVNEAAAAAEQQALREIEATAASDDPSPASPHPIPPPQAGEGVARSATGGGEDDGSQAAKPKPLGRVTAADAKRAAIAARFSKDRPHGLDFHGDYRDPAQSYGRYGEPAHEEIEAGPLARELAPEAEAQGQGEEPTSDQSRETSPQAAPAPEVQQHGNPSAQAPMGPARLLKLKVNGVEMLIPEDAVVAEAQKSLAAGNILDQAKAIREVAQRGNAASRPDQDGEPSAQTPDQIRTDAPERETQDQGDPLEQLVHNLQFGDATEAAQQLRTTIATEAAKMTDAAFKARQFDQEQAVRRRAVQKFEADNADLARDEFARDAIIRQVTREYAADLEALGVPKDQMPSDPTTIANWHIQARTQGRAVREFADILAESRTKFAAWRGGPITIRQDQQTRPAATAPRVELSPERVQRRASLPTQPSRASAPARPAMDAPRPASPEDRRSSAISAMRKGRGQFVVQ
jgi:hypothetical protein